MTRIWIAANQAGKTLAWLAADSFDDAVGVALQDRAVAESRASELGFTIRPAPGVTAGLDEADVVAARADVRARPATAEAP